MSQELRKNLETPMRENLCYIRGNLQEGVEVRHEGTGKYFVWISCTEYEPVAWNKDHIFDREHYYIPEEVLRRRRNAVRNSGGFYLATSVMSTKGFHLKGEMPHVNVNFMQAKNAAEHLIEEKGMFSGLPDGAAYDQVLKRLIAVGAISREDVYHSNQLGNYVDNPFGNYQLEAIGSRPEWQIYHINDFFGNVAEWTEEYYGSGNSVYRDGNFYLKGWEDPVCMRSHIYQSFAANFLSFRVALFLE